MQQKTEKKFESHLWRNDSLPGIDFADNQYTAHHFKPHFHHHFVIQLVEKGINNGICSGKKYSIHPNEIIIINPGETHTGTSHKNELLIYQAIYPTIHSLKYFHKILNKNFGQNINFNKTHVVDQKLVLKLKTLIYSAKNSNNKLLNESNSVDFFEYLIINYSTCSVNQSKKCLNKKRIKIAEDYIRDNYNKNFTLQELSRASTISPYHLIREFKKEKGQTPFEYLRNYKIEKAKSLLRNKSQLIDAVYETGFYDQSHFIKQFKTITGMTPKAYLC